ncbi:MAG: glycoside hydrolase, partial [Actinomycetota bacterium]|nr:glycoside hydrolase [Actinomycetota bacterium]
HQTMVAAKPREAQTSGYPNVLHQCVNAVYAAMCSRSLDGGRTWSPSVSAYANENLSNLCGAQHGHMTSSPDGHVYLPTSSCGTNPRVYISGDDGLTWRRSDISDMDTPFVDPSVSVDSDGNLYATFIDEKGWLYFTTSRNNGKTWAKPQRYADGYTANMPVIVAGDPGKVVIAYPATKDLKKGYKTKGYIGGNETDLVKKVSWGANFSVSYNSLARKPKFETTVATGKDPLDRGSMCAAATRCDYLIDFIEAVIGPDGRPYASFVDGCLDQCATDAAGDPKEGTGVGLLATLPSGEPLCWSVCWRYKGAPKAELDVLAALRFSRTPEQVQSSFEHGTMSPDMRLLMYQATLRRLDALGR